MASGERVTVVVPVFNREQLVIRCLDSVYAQTYRPIHLIVVDNNSTDSSYSVVDAWRKTHVSDDFNITLLKEDRPGAAAARQKGLDTTDTDKVYFFDSDDEMYPGILKSAMDIFEREPETELVYWRLKFNNLDGKSSLSHTSDPDNLLWNHFIHSILCTPGYLTTTVRHRQAGGWNTDMRVWDDWELGVRILLTSPNSVPLAETGGEIYCQTESITGTDFSSRPHLFEKTLDTVEEEIKNSTYPDKRALFGLVDYRRIILAAFYKRESREDLADKMIAKVFSTGRYSRFRKLILTTIYYYTTCGGRGASRLWHLFNK